MNKTLVLLSVIFLLILTGCEEKVEVVNDEIYEVNSYEAQYEGLVSSAKQIKYQIDSTMNIKVESNQEVNTNTVIYTISNPEANSILEKAKFESSLQNDQLKKLEQQLSNMSKEDPMYSEILTQKNTINDQIKLNDYTIKNTSSETSTLAKFDGKVVYDFQNNTLLLSSKDKGVNLTTDFRTLQESINNRTLIRVIDREYNLKMQSYLPVKQSNSGSESTMYEVFYLIENLDQDLIESQPISIYIDQKKVYIPKKFVINKDGQFYVKINEEIKQIEAIDQGGRVEVINGVTIGDKVSIIGENDDLFK